MHDGAGDLVSPATHSAWATFNLARLKPPDSLAVTTLASCLWADVLAICVSSHWMGAIAHHVRKSNPIAATIL